jgi:glycosyltransferase involved in cell wall biosynthesis
MSQEWKRPPRVALLPTAASANVSWVLTDGQLLEELGCHVTRYGWRGDWRGIPDQVRVARLAATHDLIYCWFAYRQAYQAVRVARWLNRPVACVAGGFDTAPAGVYPAVSERWAQQREWMLEHLAAILAMSEFSAGEIRMLTQNDVDVLYLAADGRKFHPAGEKAPIAMTIATEANRIVLKRKGVEAFLRAAPYAPDTEFHLVGAIAPEAEDIVGSLLRSNVRLLGLKPHDEIIPLLQKAAVYVQPSLHEGFGMAVAEAMLCECVPVVTAHGALPEVVGDTGIVVADQDPEGLAAAIREALRGPEKGARARRRVLESFPLSRRKEGLNRLLVRLLPHLRTETP